MCEFCPTDPPAGGCAVCRCHYRPDPIVLARLRVRELRAQLDRAEAELTAAELAEPSLPLS